jgi:tRNA dimethylallyltransferase
MSSAFFLVGPTAVGKSAVAQWIAAHGNYEILSADSMLVYRGMDIGTDKPTAEARAQVPYHGLDLVEPSETFSVWAYRAHAGRALADIAARGRPAIVAGGTGLYVKSLTDGLTAAPGADPARRAVWEQVCAEQGVAALARALQECSPALYAAVRDKGNPRRLIRALELAEAGAEGRPAGWNSRSPGAPLAALRRPPAELKTRIESRVGSMYRQGLIEEVRALLAHGPIWSATARHAIGYAEAVDVSAGRCSREDAVRETARRTWQLARRQMTWFRHQAAVKWIEVTDQMDVSAVAARVMEHWRTYGPTAIQS